MVYGLICKAVLFLLLAPLCATLLQPCMVHGVGCLPCGLGAHTCIHTSFTSEDCKWLVDHCARSNTGAGVTALHPVDAALRCMSRHPPRIIHQWGQRPVPNEHTQTYTCVGLHDASACISMRPPITPSSQAGSSSCHGHSMLPAQPGAAPPPPAGPAPVLLSTAQPDAQPSSFSAAASAYASACCCCAALAVQQASTYTPQRQQQQQRQATPGHGSRATSSVVLTAAGPACLPSPPQQHAVSRRRTSTFWPGPPPPHA